MRIARESVWKTTLVCMAGRWLVAVVGAVEIGCSINFIPVSTTVCIYLRLVGAFI